MLLVIKVGMLCRRWPVSERCRQLRCSNLVFVGTLDKIGNLSDYACGTITEGARLYSMLYLCMVRAHSLKLR